MRLEGQRKGPETKYALVGKRILDMVLASVGMLVTAPVQVIAYALIRKSLGVPVLFKQERPGWREKPFTIYKFRTMSNERGSDGDLLPDAERLTPLGVFLRETSLDELPQLWNVIRGDMSLVGPRPFLTRYLPLYSAEQRHRHDVRPGITGWTAVNGRNDQTWAEKLESDVWYTRNLSFSLDVYILWRTLIVALKREGVAREGYATGEEFRGA